MKSVFQTIIYILISMLLLGAVFALADDDKDIDKEKAPEINEDADGTDGETSVPVKNVIGGTQGFTTDFSDLTVVTHSTDQHRLRNTYMDILPSQLFVQDGYGTVKVEDGALTYECTQSDSSVTYPKLKLKPLTHSGGKLYLSEFNILTVDFDIEYDVDPDSGYANAFCALFNTRSDTTEGTITSNSNYHRFDGSGKGHYTFVYYDTGNLLTMKIFVYKDGILVDTVSNFLYVSEYDENDFYVSCLNLELTRNAGDTVRIDNLEFHYFDDAYLGPIRDLVKNPDVNLKTCKDSVLYGG